MFISKILQKIKNKKLALYLKESGRIRSQYDDQYDRTELAKQFFPWYLSLISGKTPIEIRMPWLTEGAIKKLQKDIKPGFKVLEYGCGGSTLFFLDNGCKVTSVDHNSNWLDRVEKKLQKGQRQNWLPIHIQNDDNIDNFETAYVNAPYQKSKNNEYDIILIDGLAREQCLQKTLTLNNYQKYIVLDNSDRGDADKILLKTKSSRIIIFAGPTKYSLPFTETAFIN